MSARTTDTRRLATRLAEISEGSVPNLREYAVLADGQRGIVIGPRGEIDWMCAPSWDSPAVFSGLLGGEGGYSITPQGSPYTWGGSYEEGSLVFRSRWVTTDGVVECREALAMPGDAHRAVILRHLTCREGAALVGVNLDVRADFGATTMTDLHLSRGVWTARSGRLGVRWVGGGDATRREGRLGAEIALTAGEERSFVLEISDGELPETLPDPGRLWQETEATWARETPTMGRSIAPRDSRHAYAVLRGMTRPTGGMVAAITTSLPERTEAGRNYDYRYSWIRDQCFAGQAVAADGAHPLLEDALSFVSARLLEHGSKLSPGYTVVGDEIPDQQPLSLPGYPGGVPVMGNWVRGQFQLDVFGESLLLFAAAAGHGDLDARQWHAAETAVAGIAERWQDAGAGIWEIDDQRWAHSRLIGAAGLRSLARHAPTAQAGEWTRLADHLVADVSGDCLHPSGRWQRSPDDERVDAALLLPAIRGAVPAEDPRSVATLQAIRDDLAEDYLLYRFRHDDRPLHEAEGAFLVCGFHMSLALHQQGEQAEALRWFERNRTACGSPGLLTEEFDVVQRQLRGNLPQAFVHALLLESASRLAEPDDRAVTEP